MAGNKAVMKFAPTLWEEQNKDKNKVSKKKEKQIIHPKFLELSKQTYDEFWVNFLVKAAKGILPYKFKTIGDKLYFTKNQTNVIKLEINQDTTVDECINFFKKYGSIYSHEDREDNNYEQYIDVKNISSWGEIKKTNIKHSLLIEYVNNMTNIMNLTKKQQNSLINWINFGINNGYFVNENIKIKNGTIEYITGLYYNDELKSFYIDPNIIPKKSKTNKTVKTEKNNQNKYFEQIRNFIEFLNNNEINGQTNENNIELIIE